MTLITDTQSNEQDILASIKHEPLSVVTIFYLEDLYYSEAPNEGWTNETLQAKIQELEGKGLLGIKGWDAYIGNEWVGSSEV